MDEFNKLSKYPVTLKLKDLKRGDYHLLELKKNTKYGDSVIATLYDDLNEEEKDYYIAKHHGKLSEEAIKN